MKLTQNKLSVILATVVAGVSMWMKLRRSVTGSRQFMYSTRMAKNGCILTQAWRKPPAVVRK